MAELFIDLREKVTMQFTARQDPEARQRDDESADLVTETKRH